jgi:hypothetical protein
VARAGEAKKTGGSEAWTEQYKKKALVGQTKSSVTFFLTDFFEDFEIFLGGLSCPGFFFYSTDLPGVFFGFLYILQVTFFKEYRTYLPKGNLRIGGLHLSMHIIDLDGLMKG